MYNLLYTGFKGQQNWKNLTQNDLITIQNIDSKSILLISVLRVKVCNGELQVWVNNMNC